MTRHFLDNMASTAPGSAKFIMINTFPIFYAFILFSLCLVCSNKASEIARPRGVSISSKFCFINFQSWQGKHPSPLSFMSCLLVAWTKLADFFEISYEVVGKVWIKYILLLKPRISRQLDAAGSLMGSDIGNKPYVISKWD